MTAACLIEQAVLQFRHLIQKYNLVDDILYTMNRLRADQNVMMRQGTIINVLSSAKNDAGGNAQGEEDRSAVLRSAGQHR